MEIRSVAHKALRRLLDDKSPTGLPAAYADRIEAIVSFLSDAPDIEAVRKLAVWRAHQLTGDRKGTWSLTVSRNWRITFDLNSEGEIENLDFEDYH
jgi:proteic killer suppression protein